MEMIVFKDDAGEWRWHRVAENGNIVADSSEGYVNKQYALKMANDNKQPGDTVVEA